MKFKHFLPAVALFAPLMALAMPASPDVLTCKNPDGSLVKFRLHGNHQFNYMTDVEGEFILERDAKGYVQRALRNGAFLMNTQADLDRLVEERYGDANYLARQPKTISLDSNGQTTFPSISEDVHSLVILLQYPDLKFTMDDPVDFYTRYLNDSNFNEGDLHGCAKDYFVSQSGGRFSPTFDVFLVDMPNNHTYYNDNNWRSALEAAIRSLDSKIDYSHYDYDKDGFVDTVYFFYSGYGQADTGNTEFIWPHQSSLEGRNIVLDGVTFGNYACSNSLRGSTHYHSGDLVITGIGTFCHEFSHVLSLPDLYHTTNANSPMTPGSWTIMANGPYNNDGRTPPAYSAYERWMCKWLDLEMAEPNTSYELKPIVDEPRGIKIQAKRPNGNNLNNEYYVLENRTKEGYDSYIPGEGLLIWHIDYLRTVWQGNRVNNDVTRPRCMVVFPDGGSSDFAAWPYRRGATNYDYIAPGYPSELPVYNANARADVYLTNIKYDKNTHLSTFDYNMVTEANDDKTSSITLNRVLAENGSYTNNFELSWSPVEGADDYLVTVGCQSTSLLYVSGWNRKSTGGATSVTFPLSDGMMKLPLICDVYVKKGPLPSLEPRTIRLTPSEVGSWPYGDNVGIEDIFGNQEENIAGGEGKVIAPVGAQVYTMSGMHVSNNDLPAGIYIVRYGKRVEKVIVK